MSTAPLYMPALNAFTPTLGRKLSSRDFTYQTPPSRSYVTDDFRYHRPRSDSSVSDLRDALHSIDSQMALLVRQRLELEARLERAVRLQSPVHRLPGELLSSIFVTAVLGAGENPVMLSTLMLVWCVIVLSGALGVLTVLKPSLGRHCPEHSCTLGKSHN